MSTFVLLHGAGSDSWYWHLVAPRLRGTGHEAITVDFPVDDDAAGLSDYADAALEAIGERRDLVLVAQSMAAFTAPLIAARVATSLIVLVAPMTPAPGETAGDWWANTAQAEAARQQAEKEGRDPDAPFDPVVVFLHDVPPDVAVASADHVRAQSGTPFNEPWPLPSWPAVATRFLLCRRDRLFPAEFQRRIARERLGLTPDEIGSGHLPALSRPADLATRLLDYDGSTGRRTGKPPTSTRGESNVT